MMFHGTGKIEKNRRFAGFCLLALGTAVLSLCLSPMAAYAAETTGRRVSWEEIPALVENGNPTWKAISETTDREAAAMTAACAAFQAQLYETVEMIDEELDAIRIRKAELRELKSSTVIDGKGTTAAQQIAREAENERILKQNRQEVILSVASVVLPEKTALDKAREDLQPQLTAIIAGVQELYTSRQELAAQQSSLLALLEVQEAQAQAAAAACEHGIISESVNAQNQLSLKQLQNQAESLDRNLKKAERSLKTALGIDPEEKVQFGPVPAVDEAKVSAIDPEADLKKLLENSEELKEAEGDKNFGKFGDEKLQQDEVNRIRGELTASVETAYRELMDERRAAADTKKELEAAEKQLALKEKQYGKGWISRLEYLEEKASCQEVKSLEIITELAYRKAMDTYIRLTDIKVTDPNAGPGVAQ